MTPYMDHHLTCESLSKLFQSQVQREKCLEMLSQMPQLEKFAKILQPIYEEISQQRKNTQSLQEKISRTVDELHRLFRDISWQECFLPL